MDGLCDRFALHMAVNITIAHQSGIMIVRFFCIDITRRTMTHFAAEVSLKFIAFL